MKSSHHIAVIAVFVSALCALSGCKPKESQTPPATTIGSAPTQGTPAAVPPSLADDPLATTWASIKDATYEERADFRDRVDHLSDVMDRRMDELVAKAGNASGEAREKWNQGVTEFEAARADLDQRLESFKDTSAETWDEAREGVADAWERVQNAYRELEQDVRN